MTGEGAWLAELELLDIDQGGPDRPLLSGYRGLVRFDHASEDLGAQVDFSGAPIEPGTRRRVRITVFAPAHLPRTHADADFELREGQSVIGLGHGAGLTE